MNVMVSGFLFCVTEDVKLNHTDFGSNIFLFWQINGLTILKKLKLEDMGELG